MPSSLQCPCSPGGQGGPRAPALGRGGKTSPAVPPGPPLAPHPLPSLAPHLAREKLSPPPPGGGRDAAPAHAASRPCPPRSTGPHLQEPGGTFSWGAALGGESLTRGVVFAAERSRSPTVTVASGRLLPAHQAGGEVRWRPTAGASGHQCRRDSAASTRAGTSWAHVQGHTAGGGDVQVPPEPAAGRAPPRPQGQGSPLPQVGGRPAAGRPRPRLPQHPHHPHRDPSRSLSRAQPGDCRPTRTRADTQSREPAARRQSSHTGASRAARSGGCATGRARGERAGAGASPPAAGRGTPRGASVRTQPSRVNRE